MLHREPKLAKSAYLPSNPIYLDSNVDVHAVDAMKHNVHAVAINHHIRFLNAIMFDHGLVIDNVSFDVNVHVHHGSTCLTCINLSSANLLVCSNQAITTFMVRDVC